jgi:putative membrane protein
MQTTYNDGRLHPRHVWAWVVVALAALLVIAFAFALFARSFVYPAGTVYYGYPFFGWWLFPFGFIFFFIFIFFIFRLAFWGWGGGWRHRYYRYGYGDAKEILRQRYARGEISKDQFDQMMRDLDQHS